MYLVVLNDGETFTALDGCKIVQCPETKYDDTLSKEELAGLQAVSVSDLLDHAAEVNGVDIEDLFKHEGAL